MLVHLEAQRVESRHRLAELLRLDELDASAVIAAELFNTAIENLADHLHPEIHPSIRMVKDCAAGAVLVASAGALAVGIALLVHIAGVE